MFFLYRISCSIPIHCDGSDLVLLSSVCLIGKSFYDDVKASVAIVLWIIDVVFDFEDLNIIL